MPLHVPDDIIPSPDLDIVRDGLRRLIDPGARFEIRGMPSRRSLVTSSIDAACEFIRGLASDSAIFYTINPVRDGTARHAADRDIAARTRLLIDCDPIRPGDDPASETERKAAHALAASITTHLRGLGWPDPVTVDSGNGVQLVYRIDLPNDPMAYAWTRRLLERIGELCPHEGARVDPSCCNAARLARVPGTWNRKGTQSTQRPYRLARLLSGPGEGIVTTEQIEAFIGRVEPRPEPVAATALTVPTGGLVVPQTLGVEAWYRRALVDESMQVATAPVGTRHDTLRKATRTLAGYLHHNAFTEAELASTMATAAEGAGLDAEDIRQTIQWAINDGKARPIQTHPEKPREPRTKAERAKRASEEQAEQAAAIPDSDLIVWGHEITPRAVEWLWPDRVPYGFITILAGRTGVGKSFVTLDLVARLTRGDMLPDGKGEVPQGKALIISEDPPETMTTPRLWELDARHDRYAFMTMAALKIFTLSDMALLNRVWQAADSPELIVIDPPTNFLKGADEHKNVEVRQILMNLVMWLADKKIACILITHLNKASGKGLDAVMRIIGSVAWGTTARIAHLLMPHPEKDGECVLLTPKTNLGQLPKGLGYRIAKTETLARVEWLGEVDLDADDAMNGHGVPRKSRGVVATEWLAERFRERREWPSDELAAMAKEAGISRNALFSPEVNALPIRKRQDTRADGSNHWTWVARPDWPPEENDRDCRDSGILPT